MLSERGVSDIQHVGDAGEAYEDARDVQGDVGELERDVRCITYPVHPHPHPLHLPVE